MPARSVLMVCIGATIGKAGHNTRDVSANQQINALTPDRSACPKFLYYQMTMPDFQTAVISNSAQATLPIINKSKWSNLSVWLPKDRVEQDRIVFGADRVGEECRRLAEAYRQKIDELSALKQSFLQNAFSGELTRQPDRALAMVGA